MSNDGDELRQALRRLAKCDVSEAPVVSAYLDVRPHAVGDPNVREGQVILRDRLRDIERELRERGLTEHSSEFVSFRSDVERIGARVEEAPPEAHGLAIFACSGQELFEAVELPVAPGSRVTTGPVPDLVPLARVVDQDAAMVALADTSTLRLFLLRAGALRELRGLDAPAEEFGKHLAARGELGGRVDEHRAEFAREASELIDRNLARHDPAWLIVSGDDVAVPILKDKLSKRALALLRETLHLDVRASYDEIVEATTPLIQRLRREDAHDAAQTLVDEVGEHDLGVAGLEHTQRALELGQALEVLVDETVPLAEDDLSTLVRSASATDARVRFVEDHDGLKSLGGVGALLRFRID